MTRTCRTRAIESMQRAALAAVTCGLLSAGCAPTVGYSATTSTTGAIAAKTPTCDFRVVNLPPQGDFEEIATLTQADGRALADNPNAFKAAVQADVCRLGEMSSSPR